jgi:hypothetical protein
MTEGEFRVDAAHAVLGVELAAELGLKRGDKLRIQAPAGRSDVFVVAGLFDVGNKDLNERWVFVSLRSAQTLLDLSGGISSIELNVDEIFSADRVAAAIELARRFHAEVVLKGSGSVLATPDGRWFINNSGHPGMASGGMGDVLTGLIASLLAQGWPAEPALLAAVHLHGAAADRLAREGIGPVGLTANEVAEAARGVFNGWIVKATQRR